MLMYVLSALSFFNFNQQYVSYPAAAMHFDESSPYRVMSPIDSPMDLAVDFYLPDE